jgi:uncharacterized protein (UPF0332 family)
VSPKRKDVLAREHFDSARAAVGRADQRDAVNALFYAAEAAVVWLADAHGVDTSRSHRLKADAASELHANGVLDEDYGPLLRTLNQVRKNVWYEGEDPDFDGDEIESIIEQVERLVARAEEQAP